MRVIFPLAALVCLAMRPAFAQDASYDYQSPTQYYLSARRLYPPVPNLTLRVLGQTPARFQGKTLEITGRCTGIVRQGQGGALLLIDSPRDGNMSLKMDVMPTWLQTGMQLRVLVVAMGAGEGEIVIGIPDLQVVAAASESDVAAQEYNWARNSTLRERRESEREAALRANRVRLTAGRGKGSRSLPLPSRSGTRSALTSGALAAFPQYKEFIARWNPKLSDADAASMASSVLLYAEKYDVDPRLVCALIIAESDFRPEITSHAGAMGLGQIMPDEAKSIGLTNPYDPVQSIAGATYLLRGRLDKYSGGKNREDLEMRHIILALASYNAGMGAVKKYGGVPPYRETQNYVRKIEKIYRQLCAGDTSNHATGGGGSASR